jgi:Phospholipase_D-nuclease N-terminal
MDMLIGVGSAFMLFMIVMGMALLVFWVWMFFDVIINQSEDKFVWLLVVFFLSILGSLIYYFAARKKRIAVATAPAAP